jgi:GntR family transcriptional regulator/MocR family aminotransferase
VELHVSLRGRRDLAGQIYQQVRSVIVDGRLRPGQALPPSRELAGRLAVSRTTVSAAYDRLSAEGYVAGRVGAGTFVAPVPPAAPAPPAAAETGRRDGERPVADPLRPRPEFARLRVRADLSTVRPAYDLRPGMPDARLFPYQTWRRLMSDQLRATAVGPGAYGSPAGLPELRAALARHVGVARAVRAGADDVLITNGLQQAVDLVARVLLRPGDVVAVEDPGYPPPAMLFRSLGARVAGVPVDGEGLVVDALPDAARLVLVTPSHQFPLGVRMSEPRRHALLDWARQRNAVVVEDDYDSEFRYAGRPLEPLHTIDRDGRVVYVGSLSKVMLPTLRLGFCIAPRSLRDALEAAKFTTDWHTALPTQAALARFVADGTLARHIRRMRGGYATRHRLVAEALDGPLAPWLRAVHSSAGLHVTALLRSRSVSHERAVVHRARALGVEVLGLSESAVAVPRAGLVIGLGMTPAERLPAALDRLRTALVEARP